MAKLLGARGIRSAFETTGIILVLFTLSWPLAVALLVSAPLLTPLIAQLGRRIGMASKASQVRREGLQVCCSHDNMLLAIESTGWGCLAHSIHDASVCTLAQLIAECAAHLRYTRVPRGSAYPKLAAPSCMQAAANDVSSAANEIVENMRVVKLFAQQQRELTRFSGLLEGAHQLSLKVSQLSWQFNVHSSTPRSPLAATYA